jgi:hypothetical protein
MVNRDVHLQTPGDDIGAYDSGAPHIEVRVYEQDRLVGRELCESEAEAEALVERWAQDGGFTFQIDDLSHVHGPDDVLAGESVEPPEGDHDSRDAGVEDLTPE